MLRQGEMRMTRPKQPHGIGSRTDRKKPLRVVSIDPGTTNSTIAEVRWEPGGAVTRQSRTGFDDSRLHRRD
jgi:hypothetical protein